MALLQRGGRLGDAGQVIVYATFQKQAASIAAFLDANGISAAAYHAGKASQVCFPDARTAVIGVAKLGIGGVRRLCHE